MNLDRDVTKYVEEITKISEVETFQEYRKWVPQIPYINFPIDWEVKMVPPFGGAIVRFYIKRIGEQKSVSVYLDCYDRLGCVGQPYWEIYPFKDDTFRCGINEIEELLTGIDRALGNKQKILTKL